jgi:hypothetical protein
MVMKALAGLLATLLLVVAPIARADRVSAPPGNAGVDQYFETVPSATGNRPPDSSGTSGSGHRSGGGPVPARTQRRLERLGPAGRATAALAQQTAPPPRAAHPQATSGGGSSLAAILHALGGGDSGGMGLLLPAILIATSMAAAGIAILRRRQRA